MKLGKALGIKITFNNFFLVLIVFYAFLGILPEILTVFALVFLHELAHTVVALGYGLKVREIELLPFGGVAKIQELHQAEPEVEILVALAGPMSNFFMAVFIWWMQYFNFFEQVLMSWCLKTNLTLGLFNLLPFLPLDGGRILRAILIPKIGYKRATEKAAFCGQLFGSILMVLGGWFFWQDWHQFHLLILAGFIIYAATKEKSMANYLFYRDLTRKKKELAKQGVLETRHLTVKEDAFLKDIIKFFVPNRFHLIAVIEPQGRLRAMLTEIEVIDYLFHYGSNSSVDELINLK